MLDLCIYIVFISLICIGGGAKDHPRACLDVTKSARHCKNSLLLLAARLLLSLALLGSGGGGSVVLVVLLARHVVLACLCGKARRRTSPGF